ncbi:ribosomal protein S18 acetylase RimI-like enzyme [Allocatelliglobosispora scoriae]|uniref:Ribosomal protein S18 acetylase RimI-like enzyme n=1 Tax=Allocatelliglobosispora scoriae TaxID=643052 RepID=A0A841BLV6_9ACTN|nr:GNAT family N-acetyltransferase [Allocatelliglobosispora scoriae]MBB5868635.1 ribosomal protein S18 acetylase RimI-like enzyme [Allocatelliglobosispora scoriae]
MPLSLRVAEAADGEAIASIQLVSWEATYGHLNRAMVDGLDLVRTAANWARVAEDPAFRIGLVESGGVPIGCCLSGPAETGPEGELHAVYVLPAAQRLGAGRLLVTDGLAFLAAAGYAECVLWVVDANTNAQGFYRHLGFLAESARDTWRGLPVTRYRRALSPVS